MSSVRPRPAPRLPGAVVPSAARLAVSLLALFPAAAGVGCSQAGSFRSKGETSPTVSGVDTPPPTDPTVARTAFTRQDGPLTATLLDASWIRLEPDPAKAEERHPEYFRGLTVVEVVLQTQNFVQPTKETYLLEDSTGARVTSKPEVYRGETIRGFGPKHLAEFTLVFPHVLSKDVTWVRLTRSGAEGGTVSWEISR